jgi:hypothetical protein
VTGRVWVAMQCLGVGGKTAASSRQDTRSLKVGNPEGDVQRATSPTANCASCGARIQGVPWVPLRACGPFPAGPCVFKPSHLILGTYVPNGASAPGLVDLRLKLAFPLVPTYACGTWSCLRNFIGGSLRPVSLPLDSILHFISTLDFLPQPTRKLLNDTASITQPGCSPRYWGL